MPGPFISSLLRETVMTISRRGFLGAMLAAAAAPAIVRASSLMPIVVPKVDLDNLCLQFDPWYTPAGLLRQKMNPHAVDAFFSHLNEDDMEGWNGPILTGEIGHMHGMTIIESPFVGSDRELERYRRQHARRQRAQPSNALQQLLDKARDLSNLKIRS